MPLGTQRWIHTDEPRRQEHAAHGDVLQIAVQCHLEVPEATVELEQHFEEKKKEKKRKRHRQTMRSPVQVSATFLQVCIPGIRR